MPCVLPVISFEVLSFVKMSGQSRSLVFKHGFAFSSGVIISFWALAGVMLILQAYGRSVGWGFQLQEPIFVALLAAVLLIFGLSMFGVFELGVSVTAMASKAGGQGNSGLIGFFKRHFSDCGRDSMHRTFFRVGHWIRCHPASLPIAADIYLSGSRHGISIFAVGRLS